MLASFLTGIAVGLQNFGILPESAYPIVDVGFCATLSTFSALAWEIAEMIKSKKFMSAAIYVSATFAFGMGLFFYCFGNFDKMEFLKELSFTHLSMPTEILTLLKKRISLYFYIMGNKKSLSTAIFKNFLLYQLAL